MSAGDQIRKIKERMEKSIKDYESGKHVGGITERSERAKKHLEAYGFDVEVEDTLGGQAIVVKSGTGVESFQKEENDKATGVLNYVGEDYDIAFCFLDSEDGMATRIVEKEGFEMSSLYDGMTDIVSVVAKGMGMILGRRYQDWKYKTSRRDMGRVFGTFLGHMTLKMLERVEPENRENIFIEVCDYVAEVLGKVKDSYIDNGERQPLQRKDEVVDGNESTKKGTQTKIDFDGFE